MDLVFEIPIEKKPALKALLEADPYAEKSFSRNGYKLRDGPSVGQDAGKAYVHLRCTDEFAKFAREKLAGLAAECRHDVAKGVAQRLQDEESNAEVGFGSIFGE